MRPAFWQTYLKVRVYPAIMRSRKWLERGSSTIRKYLHALREARAVKPESSIDLDDRHKTLAKQSKVELIESIGKMVVESPGLLALFGIEGFEDEVDEEMYYDY